MTRILALFTGIFAALALPAHTLAQVNLEDEIMTVGNGLQPWFGAGGTGGNLFNSLAIFLAERIMILAGITTTYIIVKAGLKLINSQADDKLSIARREIMTAVVAIFLGYLSQRLVYALYLGPQGPATALQNPQVSVTILNTEFVGIINWALELVVIISIILIIATAIKMVGSFGKEDGPAEIRKSIIGVVTGLILLTSANAIQLSLGLTSTVQFATGPITAGPIIARILHIVQIMLGFMALAGVAVIIYAGVRTIVTKGNEEEFGKAKALIGRVLLGLLIILTSYVITVLVLQLLQ